MDYNKEYEKIQEGGQWFQPDVGTHKLKLLSELSDPYEMERDGRTFKKCSVDVRVEGAENDQKLSMGYGAGPSSLFGQLVALAKLKGKLMDLEITLTVKLDKQGKRDFTIPEALEAQGELKKSAKEK